ncbi:ASCH domain-containing protein [Streptomyces apocyni]|uniref:ASCH domain-containing protein n=1 Tax=Streptomyces apocyni TaxID=2654677 RepID=UPI0012E9B42B|nr:ASCH domain-containing protein [Streptomyces apocyni]
MSDLAALPRFELAFPGPLRDKLIAAVLSGAKTTTTGLLAHYEAEGEALPVPGTRSVLLDSDARGVAIVEITEVRTLPLGDVDLRHAVDEGEGDQTVAAWRASHERFWHGPESLEVLGDPGFRVDDTTLVVTERFRVAELVDPPARVDDGLDG